MSSVAIIYPAMKFRLEAAKHLLPTGTAKGSKIQVRSDYKRGARHGHVVAATVGVRDPMGSQSHYLTKITKRCECIVRVILYIYPAAEAAAVGFLYNLILSTDRPDRSYGAGGLNPGCRQTFLQLIKHCHSTK